MFANDPYELFTPIHLAWLYRRHEKGLDVTRADLDSIEDQQPFAFDDPLFATYQALHAAGKLQKRRGRKPEAASTWWFLLFLRGEIEDQVAALKARRRAGTDHRRRGDPEPCYIAAEKVARDYRLPFSGRWLVKKISRAGIR